MPIVCPAHLYLLHPNHNIYIIVLKQIKLVVELLAGTVLQEN